MRVLQLANGYLKTKIYTHLFAELENKNIEESVFVPVKNGDTIPEVPSNVDIIPCFKTVDRFLFYSKQKKMMAWLEENYDLSSYDVVHAHTVFSGGYSAYKIHQKYGTPYVVAVRSTDINTFFKYMVHLRKLGVEIMRNAACVIFLSPAYMENTLNKWVPAKNREEIRAKSRVIPNGIAPIFFESPTKTKPAPQDELKLIFVGDINSNKNPGLIIRAVQKLRENGMNVSLKLIGTIKEDKFRSLIQNNKFVTHVDRIPHDEVIKHLRESNIFIMASHNETFGLVYAEAMSQGLPVLYTRGQGFDGHFEPGFVGFPISDTDENDMIEKLGLVTANYSEISQNCVSAVSRFNWADIAEEYVKIYKNNKSIDHQIITL